MLRGLRNVVRFNWPHYVVAAGVAAAAMLLAGRPESGAWSAPLLAVGLLAGGAALLSLIATLWVYDLSPLYRLPWLGRHAGARAVAVITAGFDEISDVVRTRLPAAAVDVFDCDPRQHRPAASIERARALHGSDGRRIAVDALPCADRSLDLAIVFMAAHELRARNERIALFAELGRCLRAEGRIVVVEHLRDPANFLAYTLGAFHFLGLREWLLTFAGAGLSVVHRSRQTPFVTRFELEVAA